MISLQQCGTLSQKKSTTTLTANITDAPADRPNFEQICDIMYPFAPLLCCFVITFDLSTLTTLSSQTGLQQHEWNDEVFSTSPRSNVDVEGNYSRTPTATAYDAKIAVHTESVSGGSGSTSGNYSLTPQIVKLAAPEQGQNSYEPM